MFFDLNTVEPAAGAPTLTAETMQGNEEKKEGDVLND
jgi:hypothetical protein